MDPLPQYGDHAFIPYLRPPFSLALPTSPSSSISTSTSSSTLSTSPNLPPITLLNTSTWTYSGPLLDPTNLPSSFHTWSQSTIHGPFLERLLPFLHFLHTFLEQAGLLHYWLTIRATKPTDEYDTVRWHTDDLFFDYDGEKDRAGPTQPPTQDKKRGKRLEKETKAKQKKGYWKLATTLLGPGTLFLKHGAQARRTQRAAKAAECAKRGEHTCSNFRCLNCLDAVEAVRQTLATSFEDHEVESPAYGEVAFFRLGDGAGAVHSEPPCHEDRIFINVVPGSEDELRGLMARWGMGFPRAWSFGVPAVGFGEDGVLSPASRSIPVVRPRSASRVVKSNISPDRDWNTNVDGDDDAKSVSTSTMSLNLREEYTDWLREKGFQFSQIFGQMGEKRESKREDTGVCLEGLAEGMGMKAELNV